LYFGIKIACNFSQGEPWHKSRTMVNPVMMQPKTAQQYASAIDGVAEDFIAK